MFLIAIWAQRKSIVNTERKTGRLSNGWNCKEEGTCLKSKGSERIVNITAALILKDLFHW